MMKSRFVVRTLTTAALVLFSSAATLAQTTTATIEGTLTDTSGGVIPGVTIEVQGETLARSAVTDAAGFYRAVALPPGRYTVTATLAGFQPRRVNQHGESDCIRGEPAGAAVQDVCEQEQPRSAVRPATRRR